MTTRPLPEPEDDNDRNILGHIARHGWSVIGIEASDEGPGYCFSVGIYHTLGRPEVLIMGLNPRPGTAFINDVGDRMRAGQKFEPGERTQELAAAYPTAIVGVDPRYYREYVGYARWLYRGSDFPMLQLVWPDKNGLFPWEPGYDARFFEPQRVLGPTDRWPHGWPFPDPPNVATFTTRQVVREGRPILSVSRDADDGAWQFHGPGEWTEADGLVVCLEEMFRRDASLAELGNLPRGWRASRKDPGEAWLKTKDG
ncbi:MAG: hypothetical protein JWO38_325 [Gemmataceae bacterium]|nr:hypothetical protein [Gemmataceae bacterium]